VSIDPSDRGLGLLHDKVWTYEFYASFVTIQLSSFITYIVLFGELADFVCIEIVDKEPNHLTWSKVDTIYVLFVFRLGNTFLRLAQNGYQILLELLASVE
jgi:hypothetical protein